MSTYVDSILSSVDQIWNWVGMVEVGNHSAPETYHLPWHGHSLHSRDRSDLRPSRSTSCHQPYPGRGRTTTQLVHHASHGDTPQEPITQPPAPEPTTAVQPSSTMAQPSSTQSTRLGRRAPVPMADFCWVDQGMGFRHLLTISPAGLPLFPGHIAVAFQALQGPTPSPVELTRHIWLLYHSQNGRRPMEERCCSHA
jgi:hypothetical protein